MCALINDDIFLITVVVACFFALKKVFLEEREKEREISPLFSLSLSLMKKKAQTQKTTKKRTRKLREKREKKN